MSNAQSGVWIWGGSHTNRIGTDGNGVGDVAERNVISGNSGLGVVINGSGTNNPVLAGNYIGLNAAGTAALVPVTEFAWRPGVLVEAGAKDTRIGTDGNGAGDAAERNVISGNAADGVLVWDSGTDRTVIAGNLIGLNAAGNTTIPNHAFGISIGRGAKNTRVGTNGNGVGDNEERNVVSGNAWSEVLVESPGTDNTVIAGNYLGTDATGSVSLGTSNGIYMVYGPKNTRIGTDGLNDQFAAFNVNERNVISGNQANGILVRNANGNGAMPPSPTSGTVIAGNYIGTNATGTAALANRNNGVLIEAGATNTRIGTDGSGLGDMIERNVISGNAGNGVFIHGVGTNNTRVAGNYLGTDLTGTARVPNGQRGVAIHEGPTGTIVGTNGDGAGDASEGNLISGNGLQGVYVSSFIAGVGSDRNVIAGNLIGTMSMEPRPSQRTGRHLDGRRSK